ncbi:MAG: cytochrome c-type biogenesis protein [Gammaproteobacteria bacterium]
MNHRVARLYHFRTTSLALLVLLLVSAALYLPSAQAIDSDSLSDPVLQTRYVAISKELRCLVCQNQSIYDSNAELAQDLRRQVREMLEGGRADEEIYRYMIERYGDYVRYRPPWRVNTLLLQLFPVFIAIFGFWMLFGTLRRHRGGKASLDTQKQPDTDSSRTSNSRHTEQP